jgi:hypothetical protein
LQRTELHANGRVPFGGVLDFGLPISELRWPPEKNEPERASAI